MNTLWLYEAMSRRLKIKYTHKILLIAFAGIHVPLLALIAYFVARTSPDLETAVQVMVVALAATLAGTAVTRWVLTHLLRPVLLTSTGLRDYATRGLLPDLPTTFKDEVGTLMAAASHSLAKLHATIDHLDNYDQVTALPNRSSLLRALGQRTADRGNYALCVLSIRNHERMVPAFGQEAGNTLVRDFSGSLENAVGPRAHLSRVGASLFAFVLEGDHGGTEAGAQASRVCSALPREFHLENIRVVPDLALGLALFPGDADNAEHLLNNAISASASAVPVGHEPVRLGFFSARSREETRHRFQLEQDLRHALDNNELVLHYQPVIDLALGRVTGAEALLRWNHPTEGLLAPGQFIPIAEATGLIVPMSAWVLQTACHQLQAWSGPEFGEFRLAINLSAQQFLGSDIVSIIGNSLRANGIGPARLEVELTETTAMNDTGRTYSTLAALREMGVSAAIDDFGTGYSSMSYLKSLPFDKIKIDREFVENVESSRTSAAICKSLIELARGLDIAVLAEGAERVEEVTHLKGMGCDMFQGFYFAHPMPAGALADCMADAKLAGAIHQLKGGLKMPGRAYSASQVAMA